MTSKALFCSLSPLRIAELVRSAQHAVCYAGPGVQLELAQAMVAVAGRLGDEMVTVSLDFDDRVMRMGYGDIDAVNLLIDAGIAVQSSPGLRTALVVVDNEGYIFTPTALYLEAEPTDDTAANAIRMLGEQVAQALARLSPAAKVIAMAQAKTPEAKKSIEALTVDVVSASITPEKLAEVTTSLKEAPPVRFDLARQVRVFEPYLQYMELSLTGAAIQRHRMAIPERIQKLGGSKELESRLRTTFELIEKGSKLSSKPLEDALNEIRKNFTPSLGKDHGRVVLGAPTEFEKNSTLRFSVGRGFASAPLWPMALRVTRGSTMTAKWHWSRSTSSAHRQQTANSPKPNALSASRAIFKKPPPGMPSKHTFCWWIAIRAGAWQSPVTPW